MYSIFLTRLAAAIATAKYSVEAVEQRAREELGLLKINDPTRIVCHCFRMPTSRDYEFICTPDGHGGITVDTMSYETGDRLESGPFKGKQLMFPVPDSED